MRNLLIVALLLPIISFCQKKPNKWDDAVIIYRGEPDIKSLGKFLLKKRIEVISLNEDLGILYTDYIHVPRSLYQYKLTIKQIDGKLYGTAFIRKVSGGKMPQASWKGGDKSANKVTFYHMYYLLTEYAKIVDANIETIKLN